MLGLEKFKGLLVHKTTNRSEDQHAAPAHIASSTSSERPRLTIVLDPGRMNMVKEILTRWPVVRQLLTHSDGTGVEAMSDRTRNLAPKHRDAQVSRSVCPYCAAVSYTHLTLPTILRV